MSVSCAILHKGKNLFSRFAWAAQANRENRFLPLWRMAQLTDIQHENGSAYLAATHDAELSSHEKPSLAEVWEEGRQLAGPSNALHDDIRKIGIGRYSFWHAQVYFSTSDNSDPRTNGRHYRIHYPWILGKVGAFALYALAILIVAWAAPVRLFANVAVSLAKSSFSAVTSSASSAIGLARANFIHLLGSRSLQALILAASISSIAMIWLVPILWNGADSIIQMSWGPGD